MSESAARLRFKQKLLKEQQLCCFCGGMARAVSIDHIPPRSAFPAGYHPDGFVFPACDRCNQSSRKDDDVFGFWAVALDFDEGNFDENLLRKRLAGISNNHPTALPLDNLTTREKRKALRDLGVEKPIGSFFDEVGVFRAPPDLKDACMVAARKMACALYYKETGRIISADMRISAGWYQAHDKRRERLTEYFNENLPQFREGARVNIKNYGNRFKYKFGYKSSEDFFGFACQVGSSIILYGFAFGDKVATPEKFALPVWYFDEEWKISK